MSSPLRELFALFDVDTGAAETKLKSLTSSTDTAKAALGALATSALGAFSAQAIFEFVDSMIELGSTLNDTSERLGVGTEELQQFQYAAKMTGVDAEEAAKALGFLNRNVGEALGDSKEASQQFAEMGIQLKDGSGNVRELGDMLPEIADSFAAMGSQQERTAAAMKIFGRSGAALLPMLKDGADGLAEMNERFDALGLGIKNDFIQKADAAGDAVDTLKLGFRSLKTRIAVEVLPAVTAFAQKLSTWVAWGQKVVAQTNIVKELWAGLAIAAGVSAGIVVYKWSKVLGLFPKGASLFENFFALGKMGLYIGALVLLGLAIEDIVTMCQGGESVLGDFLDQFLGVEEKQELVDSLTKSWEDMQPAIEDLGPPLAEFGKVAAEVLPLVVALVADAIKIVLTLATEIMGLGEYLATVATKGLAAGNKVAAETADKVAGIWAGGSTTMKVADAMMNPSVPASSVRQPTDFSRGDNITNVTVNGGPSNEDTGRAVGRAVRNANDEADRRTAANALTSGTE